MNGVASDIAIAGIDAVFSNSMRVDFEFVSKRLDIDGTLLNSKKEITPSVFEAIQDAKAAGVKIVITTGRPIAGVSKL